MTAAVRAGEEQRAARQIPSIVGGSEWRLAGKVVEEGEAVGEVKAGPRQKVELLGEPLTLILWERE